MRTFFVFNDLESLGEIDQICSVYYYQQDAKSYGEGKRK